MLPIQTYFSHKCIECKHFIFYIHKLINKNIECGGKSTRMNGR